MIKDLYIYTSFRSDRRSRVPVLRHPPPVQEPDQEGLGQGQGHQIALPRRQDHRQRRMQGGEESRDVVAIVLSQQIPNDPCLAQHL